MSVIFELLGLSIAAVSTLFWSLLVVAPALGGAVHGRRFRIEGYHAIWLALSLFALLAQLVAYGWWRP